MEPKIIYWEKGNLYLNITNDCVNNCVFCLKNFKTGYDSLKLDREPSSKEVIEAIKSNYNPSIDEIVFCGLGESLMRLDDVLFLARKIKEKYPKKLRMNTAGQVKIMYPGRNIASELKEAGVDRASISLNADTSWLYNHLCRPLYVSSLTDQIVYEKILEFANECSKILETELTVVDIPLEKMPDGLPAVNIIECEGIAKKLGVKFRKRAYFGPSLKSSLLHIKQ